MDKHGFFNISALLLGILFLTCRSLDYQVTDRCGMSPVSLGELKKTIARALQDFVDIESEEAIEVSVRMRRLHNHFAQPSDVASYMQEASHSFQRCLLHCSPMLTSAHMLGHVR